MHKHLARIRRFFRLVAAAFAATLATECIGAAENALPSPVSAEAMDAYLAIQESLAADTIEGIADHAAKLGRATGLPSAEALEEADTIKSARLHFKAISDALIAQAKESGVEGESVRLAHCPMAFQNKGASWLQADQKLANPYYGSMMLRCGTFKESFEPSSGESEN